VTLSARNQLDAAYKVYFLILSLIPGFLTWETGYLTLFPLCMYIWVQKNKAIDYALCINIRLTL